MDQNIIKFLAEVPLFAGLHAEDRDKVASVMSSKTIKKREILFNEGEPCSAIFLIQTGRIKVYKTTWDGRDQIVNLLSDGEMFPHVGMFGGSPYPATAEAMEDCRLYSINVEELTRMLLSNPELGIRMLRVFEDKIRTLQSRLSDVLSKDMTDKIMNTLTSLASTNGIDNPEGCRIDMELTQQDVANLVGTTRETASRVISQLKKEGKIEFDSRHIIIKW
ncbi:Crp/Fnr family transcriptional regulator [Aneurinibacillus sp. Ricciae_BoGa-3]|uniref:Crp/Fnr family transcriptional regulator n=1 Tax=Aneurinibacillus sp. Ricciae_BoGa-3 TaxID=3022697 RepID=UPI00233FE032|nr:Crp/Fnr family transcriptional regulator [Aneurinibacillus sp. Ricciae_BoGa-3]WCK55829.1 Crp/Fnr family transcriptional regulator [Aneurinibacillus sp. Ricciae_BoGa-3]